MYYLKYVLHAAGASAAEPVYESRREPHHSCPASGARLQASPLIFDRLKLTNDAERDDQVCAQALKQVLAPDPVLQIPLKSMHMYAPVVTVCPL